MDRQEQYNKILNYIKSLDIFSLDSDNVINELLSFNDNNQVDIYDDKNRFNMLSKIDMVDLDFNNPGDVYNLNIELTNIYKIYHKDLYTNILLNEYLSGRISFKENSFILCEVICRLNKLNSPLTDPSKSRKYLDYMFISSEIAFYFFNQFVVDKDNIIYIDTDHLYTKLLSNVEEAFKKFGYEYVIEETNVFMVRKKLLFEYDDHFKTKKHYKIRKENIDRRYPCIYEPVFRELKFRKLLL